MIVYIDNKFYELFYDFPGSLYIVKLLKDKVKCSDGSLFILFQILCKACNTKLYINIYTTIKVNGKQ